MPLVRTYADIPNQRVQTNMAGGHFAWRTDFLKAPAVRAEDSPVAFLAEGSAGRVLDTHFQSINQSVTLASQGSGQIRSAHRSSQRQAIQSS